jgi:hypothetical protein
MNNAYVFRTYSLINQFYIDDSRTFSSVDFYGGQIKCHGNDFQAPVTINEGPGAPGTDRYLWESHGNSFGGGLTINYVASPSAVTLESGDYVPTLTVNGPLQVQACADAVPVNPTLTGGASIKLLTSANSVNGDRFVFNNGLFTPSTGNVYTDLLALLTEAQKIDGLKTIEVYNSLGTLPVGTYDFTDCEIVGHTKGLTMQFAAGSRIVSAKGSFLSGLPIKIKDINFAFNGGGTDAGDFCTLPTNNEIELTLENADLISDAGASGGSMFKVSSTTQLSLTLIGSSKVQQNSEVAGWNMFRGPGGSQLNVYMACGIDGGITPTTPSLLGDVISAVFSGIGQFEGVSAYTQTVGEVYYSRAAFYFDGGSGLWKTRADARHITAHTGNLAANVDNYSPPDLAACDVLYVTPTVANVNCSGFDSALGRVQYGVAPQPRTVINNGTGNFNILNLNAGSLPYNQVKTSTGATAVLAPNQMGVLVYENTGNPATGFWRFAKLS